MYSVMKSSFTAALLACFSASAAAAHHNLTAEYNGEIGEIPLAVCGFGEGFNTSRFLCDGHGDSTWCDNEFEHTPLNSTQLGGGALTVHNVNWPSFSDYTGGSFGYLRENVAYLRFEKNVSESGFPTKFVFSPSDELRAVVNEQPDCYADSGNFFLCPSPDPESDKRLIVGYIRNEGMPLVEGCKAIRIYQQVSNPDAGIYHAPPPQHLPG